MSLSDLFSRTLAAITVDGTQYNWTGADRIDNPGDPVTKYVLYSTVPVDTYLIARRAADTTNGFVG